MPLGNNRSLVLSSSSWNVCECGAKECPIFRHLYEYLRSTGGKAEARHVLGIAILGTSRHQSATSLVEIGRSIVEYRNFKFGTSFRYVPRKVMAMTLVFEHSLFFCARQSAAIVVRWLLTVHLTPSKVTKRQKIRPRGPGQGNPQALVRLGSASDRITATAT